MPIATALGYRLVTGYMVTKNNRKSEKNPDTGILYGAESYDTGPNDSSGAVLLIHGFIGAGNNFNDLPERLASLGWHVRVMRLPGHGTSPSDLEKETADSMLRAVREELDNLRKTHDCLAVVGHSMGGTLGILAAAETGVDRLVLCAPYFGATRKWYYLLSPETWASVSYPVVRWVYKGRAFVQVNRKEAKNKIVSYRWVPTQGFRILMELGKRADSPEILNRVSCPVLLLHSRGDNAASWECAEKAFDSINSTGKRAVWLKTSNHHIFWDYEHDEVIEEIEKFLGRVEEK
ncbi:alpha/beta hydrolase [Candidatus Latescibacterota bacterium]